MSRIYQILIIYLIVLPLAQASVEIDEYGSAIVTTAEETRVTHRRAAIGVAAGGLSGIFGALLELNFTARTGFLAGVGYSNDYQSIQLGIKHFLSEGSLTPYLGGGYSRWFANGRQSPVGSTTPGFLAKRFLSDNEKRTGRFGENLIFSNLGIQFLKLSGDFAGSGVYFEAIALVDVDDLLLDSTLGLGYLYYF